MRLEVGTFPVSNVSFGSRTQLEKGALEIDRDELVELALQDGRIPWAGVDIVRPGDSARLINARDMLQPQAKAEGAGVVYPGICGRSPVAVGEGRTFRLSDVAVMTCVDKSKLSPAERSWPSRVEQAERESQRKATPDARGGGSFIDMSGPGLKPPLDGLTLVCVTLEAPGGEGEESNIALDSAALRVSDRLAQVTAGMEPPETEVFALPRWTRRCLASCTYPTWRHPSGMRERALRRAPPFMDKLAFRRPGCCTPPR